VPASTTASGAIALEAVGISAHPRVEDERARLTATLPNRRTRTRASPPPGTDILAVKVQPAELTQLATICPSKTRPHMRYTPERIQTLHQCLPLAHTLPRVMPEDRHAPPLDRGVAAGELLQDRCTAAVGPPFAAALALDLKFAAALRAILLSLAVQHGLRVEVSR
jgi:hypothetical protein